MQYRSLAEILPLPDNQEEPRHSYLNKYISLSTFTDTGITMRIHDTDGPVIERSEVQNIQSSGSCKQAASMLETARK